MFTSNAFGISYKYLQDNNNNNKKYAFFNSPYTTTTPPCCPSHTRSFILLCALLCFVVSDLVHKKIRNSIYKHVIEKVNTYTHTHTHTHVTKSNTLEFVFTVQWRISFGVCACPRLVFVSVCCLRKERHQLQQHKAYLTHTRTHRHALQTDIPEDTYENHTTTTKLSVDYNIKKNKSKLKNPTPQRVFGTKG